MKTLVFTLLLVSFWYVAFYAVDPDLGWHMRVGEEIWLQQEVPHNDKYSYTMPQHDWVDHEWLVDAFMWRLNTLGAWWLVAAVFTGLTVLPFFVWIRRSESFFALWLIFLAGIFTLHFAGVRPQMISFFFLFVLLELLDKRKIVFLPVLFFVWANLHAGFAAGLFVWGIYIVAYHGRDIRQLVWELLVLLLSLGATLLNPYGYDLYKEILHVASSQETMQYIGEWRPLNHFPLLSFWILCGILIGLLVFGKGYQKIKKPTMFVAAAAFLLTLVSARHGLLFIAAAAPLMILGTKNLLAYIEQERAGMPFSAIEISVMRAGFVALFVVSTAAILLIAQNRPLKILYPEGAAAFLQERAAGGEEMRVFNEYGWGGYVIWNAPDMSVFIDGRMPHWVSEDGTSAMKDYIAVVYSSSADARREVFERRGVTHILQAKPSKARGVRGQIRAYLPQSWLASESYSLQDSLAREGWEVAYEDDISFVMQRKNTPR